MRTHPLRRLAAVVSALALTPAVTLAIASPAHAATPFIVVGTSDVSDSNLMAAVIEPGFERAYPQYDLQYKAQGTGAAISTAESGQAAALLVHAAAVENQFVAQGFSLEPAGRSIFWGDYVLVGPTSDPAGVEANSPHDIVGAFQRVAAAGAAGTAKFVQRTTSPGTAIQERQIWALTSGVPLCTGIDPSKGGGARPTNGPATCSNPDDSASYPAWYSGSNQSQSGNLLLASNCVAQGGNCYDFIDRGTFAYQQSIGNATNMKIVTRDNDPAAKGGQAALINAFHAYGINPAKFAGANNTDATAATLFLNFITSAAEQQQIGDYLGDQQPFVPAAAPILTSRLRGKTASSTGKTVVKGNLANAIPGYPVLGGVPVNLLKADSDSPLAVPKVVATDLTNSQGNYKLKAKLKAGKFYSVGTGSITKLEFPSLNPPFSDILQPASSPLGTSAKVVLQPVERTGATKVLLSGRFGPKSQGTRGRLIAYAGHPGKKMKRVGRLKLNRRQHVFHFSVDLGPGKYHVQLAYVNRKKDLIRTQSATRSVNLS